MMMEPVLRNACDACHKLKTKCPTEGTGACANCRRKGQICTFSPRSEMGRPRLSPEKAPSQRQKRSGSTQNAPSNKRRISSASVESNKPGPVASSPEEVKPQPVQDFGNDALCQPAVDSGLGEPLVMGDLPMGDFPSTLPEGLCGFLPYQQDFFMPEPSPFDLSWPYTAPPPYSSPVLITALPDTTAFMPPLNLPCESSSDTSSSGPGLLPFLPDADSGAKQPGLSSTRDNTPESEPDILVDAYSQLANVHFGLLTSYSKCKAASGGLPALLGSLEEVFPLVSSLCDIFNGTQLNHLLNTQGDPASPCLLLAGSVISTVVEIYCGRMGPFQPSGKGQPPAVERGTHYRLQLQTDATVMEFHLMELRPILKMAHVGVHDSHTIDLMDTMRRTLRDFLEEWEALNTAC